MSLLCKGGSLDLDCPNSTGKKGAGKLLFWMEKMNADRPAEGLNLKSRTRDC